MLTSQTLQEIILVLIKISGCRQQDSLNTMNRVTSIFVLQLMEKIISYRVIAVLLLSFATCLITELLK
jgi:hypothetical protein